MSATMICTRDFEWTSSTQGDPARLASLQEAMDSFYSRPEARQAYQDFIDKREAESFEHPFERLIAGYLTSLKPESVLEAGCGSGRLFRTLRRAGFAARYVGMEVADWIVADCRRRHPDAEWIQGSAYNIPAPSGAFDVCFSYGVIESLVYPETALAEMVRVLRPGGRLVLLFPDFVESGHLGSQLTGFSPGRLNAKLRRGKWFDAAVSWYDQKIRLPRALRRARERLGPFPINLAPVALAHPRVTLPDYDAVYVSSKADIEAWAAARRLAVEYPHGRQLAKAYRARSWVFAVVTAT
ncbi:MAG TPA: class I SAM-dependent methyltransferase [Myxococcales bacterium]